MGIGYMDIATRWIEHATGVTKRALYTGSGHYHDRMYARGDEIYSYGSHFEMARVMRDGKGNPRMVLINGERASVTTTSHQGCVRSAVGHSHLPSVLIPYGALSAANVDFDSIQVVDVTPDKNLTLHKSSPKPRRGVRWFEDVPITETAEYTDDEMQLMATWLTAEKLITAQDDILQRRQYAEEELANGEEDGYWLKSLRAGELEMPLTVEPVTVDDWQVSGHRQHYVITGHDSFWAHFNKHAYRRLNRDGVPIPHAGTFGEAVPGPQDDGKFHWTVSRHVLGESVITATVRERGRRVRHNVKFLSGFDHGEPDPFQAYFFCELPKCDAATVAEAYEALKPDAVVLAEGMGRTVKRQGDIFAVPVTTPTRELTATAKRRGYKNAGKGFTPIATAIRVSWSGVENVGPVYTESEFKIVRERKATALLLGTNHEATETIIAADGTTYARGCLYHIPDGRSNDHVRVALGKNWHVIVKNTVPVR